MVYTNRSQAQALIAQSTVAVAPVEKAPVIENVRERLRSLSEPSIEITMKDREVAVVSRETSTSSLSTESSNETDHPAAPDSPKIAAMDVYAVSRDVFNLTNKVVKMLPQEVTGRDTIVGEIIPLTEVIDLYTAPKTMIAGSNMMNEAAKAHSASYGVIGLMKVGYGLKELLDALMTIPTQIMTLSKASSVGVVRAMRGMDKAGKALSFIGPIFSVIPKLFDLYESIRLTRHVGKLADLNNTVGALEQLKKLVEFSPERAEEIARNNSAINQKQLKKLTVNTEIYDTLPDEVKQVIDQVVGESAHHNDSVKLKHLLAQKVSEDHEGKLFRVAQSLGESVCTALQNGNIENEAAFVNKVVKHARRKQLLDTILICVNIASFTTTILSFVAGPGVSIAAKVLSLITSVVLLAVDVYYFKKDVDTNGAQLKQKLLLLALNAILLGTVIAATVASGGVGMVATSAILGGTMMALNLYIMYKTRHDERRHLSVGSRPADNRLGLDREELDT